MRKLTEPGVAPPAPGSVRPPVPARPGAYTHVREPVSEAGWTDPDEVPTKPDNAVQPELLRLVRMVDAMPTVERRRFLAMAENYGKCPLGRRVLLEEFAREMAQERKP